MKFHVKEIALRQGIKNARQLTDQSGINATSVYQLWNGTAKLISFEVMDTLCNFLKAGPGLLFEYTPVVEGSDPVSNKRKPGKGTKRPAK